MLSAILNSSLGFSSGVKIIKSSSNLKLHRVVLSVKSVPVKQVKLWHQQICYFVFLIVGCIHFSIINVFRLFYKHVSHLKSSS